MTVVPFGVTVLTVIVTRNETYLFMTYLYRTGALCSRQPNYETLDFSDKVPLPQTRRIVALLQCHSKHSYKERMYYELSTNQRVWAVVAGKRLQGLSFHSTAVIFTFMKVHCASVNDCNYFVSKILVYATIISLKGLFNFGVPIFEFVVLCRALVIFASILDFICISLLGCW